MNKQDKTYAKALIDALRPYGAVLEVGFGKGEFSTLIQTHCPTSHTIIEWEPEAAAGATKWAENYSSVSIIRDSWQHALLNLGIFDAIFFNDRSDAQMVEHKEAGSVALRKEKELLSMAEEKLPQLTSIRYSDHDLDTFCREMGHLHAQEISRFLHELKENAQISEKQYEALIERHHLEKVQSKNNPFITKEFPDTSLIFFEACIKNHTHKGSRLSCFSGNSLSKYENPEFFERIITNPHLDYQEILNAGKLIMVIEKL